jgi:tRNA G10  N-methylase Trm11
MQSILILGRQPALGLAELESLYGAEAVVKASPHVAGLNLHASEVNFARLGGSTRLAHVLTTLPSTDWRQIERELPLIITELALTLPDGKIRLGLSAFGVGVSAGKLNACGLTLKKVLRDKNGRNARVIPNPEVELNTAQVLHNKLTGATGIELLLVATSDGQTIVARTHEAQNIDSYALRDRGRPKRDARVGMLPPKLAQILINLATAQSDTQDKILLDPFCGTGVVLQEALLMGINVYGTDLEPRMVDYTGENLDWLSTQFELPDATMRIEAGDATSYSWDPRPDFVVGETYLGRPFTEKPSPEILARTVSEVNLIQRKFLQNIHNQLEPGTRLCLAVPAWQTSPGVFKHLPLIDQIDNLGYNRIDFERVLDEHLLYYREDQTVARQVLVLTRK